MRLWAFNFSIKVAKKGVKDTGFNEAFMLPKKGKNIQMFPPKQYLAAKALSHRFMAFWH